MSPSKIHVLVDETVPSVKGEAEQSHRGMVAALFSA